MNTAPFAGSRYRWTQRRSSGAAFSGPRLSDSGSGRTAGPCYSEGLADDRSNSGRRGESSGDQPDVEPLRANRGDRFPLAQRADRAASGVDPSHALDVESSVGAFVSGRVDRFSRESQTDRVGVVSVSEGPNRECQRREEQEATSISPAEEHLVKLAPGRHARKLGGSSLRASRVESQVRLSQSGAIRTPAR